MDGIELDWSGLGLQLELGERVRKKNRQHCTIANRFLLTNSLLTVLQKQQPNNKNPKRNRKLQQVHATQNGRVTTFLLLFLPPPLLFHCIIRRGFSSWFVFFFESLQVPLGH